ncbi:MAG: MBL fold metallo-hydrolase [Bacteroidales bacterium]|jgi:7,8-dihydropterin-6-yl-methyl-4-(beta-D-ribofuranosyl)aminobenzene 5'-phosphate synthase|nr:MBL fold metallo-hydrolase [Bacteroidales bacterium]
MKSIRSLSILLLLILLVSRLAGQDYRYLESIDVYAGISSSAGIDNPVTVKVIYDNYVKVAGLKEDWGYSILIEGLEKNILFDTGTKPEIFESNFRKMGIDAGSVDLLVISHEHGDHTGGIPAFVKMKKGIPVIIPHSFSDRFKKQMTEAGLEPLLVKQPALICANMWTSGEFEYQIAEHSLVLNTKKGLVVMTGCSHPGIIEMLKKIRADFNKNIYMVFGGFHLMQKSDKEMDEIISQMKALGVVKCGATHCTGDKQINMFRNAFGENYFELGVGNIILIL